MRADTPPSEGCIAGAATRPKGLDYKRIIVPATDRWRESARPEGPAMDYADRDWLLNDEN